jgi:hypothetical protein
MILHVMLVSVCLQAAAGSIHEGQQALAEPSLHPSPQPVSYHVARLLKDGQRAMVAEKIATLNE